jgi:hypothetical protein
MAGGPALEERFASPKLGSFAQRVAARCYLEPLGSEETAAYVRAQFSMSGGDPARLISEDAVRSVYRATDGIPRLINQVCDHALVLAALGGHSKLTSEAIDESWADLQQLPSPWSASIVRDGAASQIVEFGHLSDDVESPEAIPFRASELTRHAKSTHSLHLATPDEQLDAIAEQLLDMEESDRRPTATTEVDLDFPEFGDPFGEEFAEEELVLDNYASEFEIFAEVPRVASWEGRQIGSQLQPLAPTAPTLSAAQPTPPANRSTPPAEPAFSLPVGIPASNASRVEDEAFSAASDPVMPEEAEDCTIPSLASITAAHPARATPAPVTAATAPEILVPDVSVLRTSSCPVLSPAGVVGAPQAIVVEEESTPTRANSVMSPRRSEFRQLFSKLRRG